MDQTLYGENRRRHPRVLFSDTPWVLNLVLGDRPAGPAPLRLEAKNISLGGMKILSNYRFFLFQQLQLQLLDKMQKMGPITLQGKIIRLEETDTGQLEKNFGLGIEFEILSATILSQLQAVLPDK